MSRKPRPTDDEVLAAFQWPDAIRTIAKDLGVSHEWFLRRLRAVRVRNPEGWRTALSMRGKNVKWDETLRELGIDEDSAGRA